MKNNARYLIVAIPVMASLLACFFLFYFFVEIIPTLFDDGTRPQPYKPNFLATPTTYPQLGEAESDARLEALLKNNGGCQLPCWWGIVPGTTTWRQAHAILSPFMKLDLILVGDKRNNETYFRGSYAFKDNLWVSIETQDQTVHTIRIEMQDEYLSNLGITRLFQSYGRPDQIYIRVHNLQPDIPFQIFLYYPSQGIAAEYLYYVSRQDQTIQLCTLDKPSSAAFYTGEPTLFQDFSTIAESALWHPKADIILRLDEASEWTQESFFQTIKGSTVQKDCISTPASLWVENK